MEIVAVDRKKKSRMRRTVAEGGDIEENLWGNCEPDYEEGLSSEKVNLVRPERERLRIR